MANDFTYNLDDERFRERDHPLVTSCRLPGLAEAIGLRPAPSAAHELVRDTYLTNICMAGEADKAMSYSRRRARYPMSRYRRSDFTYGNVTRVAADIVGTELVTEDRTEPGVRGRQSTLKATPELMALWSNIGRDPIYDGSDETIILKSRDEERRLLEYVDTPAVRAMRDDLRTINEMFASMDVEVPGGKEIANGLLLFEKPGKDKYGRPVIKRHHVRLSQKTGRRIFAEQFNRHLHGRLYVAFQNIPSDARKTMRINGEACIELDFEAMHPTLAYNEAGIRMDDKPYALGHGITRNEAKLGLLIGFNADDRLSAVRALVRDDDELQIPYHQAVKIIDAVFERHDPIRRMLCTDSGIKFMNIDSRITVGAMKALVDRGIPVIGVHDSLIVPTRFEGQAREEMDKSWCKHSKGPNPCSIK
jgi:hypothetical protein